MNFQAAIDIARARNGRPSLNKVARESGVSPSLLQRVCNGESDPTLRSLRRLAGYFSMKVSEFIALAEDETIEEDDID